MRFVDWTNSATHPLTQIAHVMDQLTRSLAVDDARVPIATTGSLPINLWSTQDELKVTCEVPGISAPSLTVNVVGDLLEISGRPEPKPASSSQAKPAVPSTDEHGSGFISRSVRLPYRVDSQRTTAHLSQGILTISLHRPEADKPRRITVNAS